MYGQKNYDREVSDLLPLEREVTAGIAEQVHLQATAVGCGQASEQVAVATNGRSIRRRTISIFRAAII